MRQFIYRLLLICSIFLLSLNHVLTAADYDNGLFSAIENGDHAQVDELLRTKWDNNLRYSAGDTIAQEQAKDGWTPLMYAIDAKQTDIAFKILKYSKNVNIQGGNRKTTALILAASIGENTLIDALAKRKANLKDQFAGDAINAAIQHGHINSVNLLLRLGVRHSIHDHDGLTPLVAAIHSDKPEIVDLLLRSGADPNECKRKVQGDSDKACPLTIAADLGRIQTIEYLLNHKAKINATNVQYDDLTPLIAAVQSNQYEAVRLLLSKGANANQRNKYGLTAIEVCRSAEVAQLLIEKGAQLHGEIRENALATAISIGETTLSAFWIEKGASLKSPTVQSAFVRIAGAGNYKIDMVRAMLKAGIDPNSRSGDWRNATALIAAVESGVSHSEVPLEIVRILLEYGADVNAKDSTQLTALNSLIWNSPYGWCEERCLAVAMKLVDAKADVNTRGKHEITPVRGASRLTKGKEALLNLLKAAGANS